MTDKQMIFEIHLFELERTRIENLRRSFQHSARELHPKPFRACVDDVGTNNKPHQKPATWQKLKYGQAACFAVVVFAFVFALKTVLPFVFVTGFFLGAIERRRRDGFFD